jgi:hypothetical protein
MLSLCAAVPVLVLGVSFDTARQRAGQRARGAVHGREIPTGCEYPETPKQEFLLCLANSGDSRNNVYQAASLD